MERLIVLGVLAVCALPVWAQSHQRYHERTSFRVDNRVIAVGDSIDQLKRNRPSHVSGAAYTFTGRNGRVTCYVGRRGICQRLVVW